MSVVKNRLPMKMMNTRVFFPVGMGGFSFERMDETTIVYDCGSYKSQKTIEGNIMALKREVFTEKNPVINHLFLSHFDEDHCNGVEKLLAEFTVNEIHLPYIDYKYRAVLSFLSCGGPKQLFQAITGSSSVRKISMYKADDSSAYSIKSKNGRWEWVIKNLLNRKFFEKAKSMLEGYGVTFNEHVGDDPLEELIVVGDDSPQEVNLYESRFRRRFESDVTSMLIYTPQHRGNYENIEVAKTLLKESIPSFECLTLNDKLKKANIGIADILNDIEKNAGHAKNEYGMLLLSKHIAPAYTAAMFFKNQPLRLWWRHHRDLTSCLYTGDMSMTADIDMAYIQLLLQYNGRYPLQFFQIPHHGSRHNSNLDRLDAIDAEFYFCYDNNCKRLVQNIGNMLSQHNPISYPLDILLIDKTSEMDEVLQIK